MLALPERVADPLPHQVLSLEELAVLTAWKLRYRLEAVVESMGLSERNALAMAARLRFAHWAYRHDRFGAG